MSVTFTPLANTKARFNFEDINAKMASVTMWLAGIITDPTAAGPAALRDDLSAMSNAALTTYELGIIGIRAPGEVTPGTGAFDSVKDKMLLEFSTADGSLTKMNIPGVLTSVLNADSYTLNHTSGAGSTSVGILLTNLKDAEGNALVALKKTYRRRSPNRKKLNQV